MNSGNSNLPPRTEGLRKPNGDEDDDTTQKPKQKSEWRKSGRNPVGQKSRKGNTLKKYDKPELIERFDLTHCPKTRVKITKKDIVGVKKRQIFDIPSEHDL